MGCSVDGEPVQLFEDFSYVRPAGQQHLGNKSLILEKRGSPRITGEETKEEIGSAVMSSIVRVARGGRARRRVAAEGYRDPSDCMKLVPLLSFKALSREPALRLVCRELLEPPV